MNNLEMIYYDDEIEIYVKSDLLSSEYVLTNQQKVIARYYDNKFRYVYLELKMIKLEHLNKFYEVALEHYTKSLDNGDLFPRI